MNVSSSNEPVEQYLRLYLASKAKKKKNMVEVEKRRRWVYRRDFEQSCWWLCREHGPERGTSDGGVLPVSVKYWNIVATYVENMHTHTVMYIFRSWSPGSDGYMKNSINECAFFLFLAPKLCERKEGREIMGWMDDDGSCVWFSATWQWGPRPPPTRKKTPPWACDRVVLPVFLIVLLMINVNGGMWADFFGF